MNPPLFFLWDDKKQTKGEGEVGGVGLRIYAISKIYGVDDLLVFRDIPFP